MPQTYLPAIDEHNKESSGKMDTMERAFILLEAAATGQGLSFAEVDRILGGISPSTLSRLLKKLCAYGMLEHDSAGLYRPAPRMNQLAAKIMKTQPRHELLRPLIRQLALQTCQSAAYFEKAENGAVLLAKYEMPSAFHYLAEGQVNSHVKTQGFIKILYDDNPPQVLSVLYDDNEFLRRVVAPVRLPGGGHGALGISFYSAEFLASQRVRYEKYCDHLARQAESLLAKASS